MDKMNICFVSGEEYAKYLEALIVSILLNSNKEDNFHFHIIEDNISDDYKNDIFKLKEIKEFDITYYQSPNIEKYKKWAKHFKSVMGDKYVWSYQVYLKLDILTLFYNLDINRMLFLDTDQIVLSRLNRFFEVNMGKYYLYSIQYPLYNCFNYRIGSFLNKIKLVPIERYILTSTVMLINLKILKEENTKENIIKKIDYCFDNYKNLIFTEEQIFTFVCHNKMLCVDHDLNNIQNLDTYKEIDWDVRKIKILHYTGSRLNKYLSYTYNEDIEHIYITFWEYFCQTPFYKNNYVEYSNIHMAHLRRWLLQEREERKWHIEDSRNYTKSNYNRLLNMILWIIPFKSIRNKLRTKYIIN